MKQLASIAKNYMEPTSLDLTLNLMPRLPLDHGGGDDVVAVGPTFSYPPNRFTSLATSPDVRKTIASYPRLESILGSLDVMRPPERDARMQQLLGIVNGNEPLDESTLTDEQAEDARAFQAFAADIERAIRSSGSDDPKTGLDWDQP